MRKFLKVIMKVIICLVIVLNIGSTPVFASDINISGTSVSWSFENNVLTISGTGAMADYETNENSPWFQYEKSIKKIVIKDGVTHIGNSTFVSCINVTSVEIASSVKTIGEDTFANCDGLTSVDIPYGVETIGQSAFVSCGNLNSVNIPSTVTEIGDSAFSYTQLTNVRVPAGCKLSGQYTSTSSVFDNAVVTYYGSCGTNISWELNESTGALTLSGTGAMVEFQQSQEGIATPWNQYSSKIKSLVIGDGITTISIGAFYNCSNLTSITFGSGLKTIEDMAFSMTGLTSVNIPGNVTTIGMYAFYMCTSLANITLAEGVETIGDAAFAGCGSKNVVIPVSVTSVGGNALGGGKFETIYNLSKMVLQNTSYSSDPSLEIFASVYSPLSVGEGVNITCGETQSYNGNILYKAGSQITLTPKSNMKISNVTVNNEVIEASGGTYSFTMPEGATNVAFTLTCPVTYCGAQMRANADGTYDIRFIATIDTLDQDAVGFVLSKSETNPTKETANANIISTTKVYNSITAMGSTVTAESLGGTYIIACMIKNIPESDVGIPLYVRAFATKGTETTYTEVHTVTVSGLK